MRIRACAFLAAAVLACLAPAASHADLSPYSQDFELLVQTDTAALTNDGWVVYGNVFAPGGAYLYGYGPFGAPNDGAAFCQIDLLQGGPEQGLQQLVVFSDYNNGDHANGNIIESNVFHERTIEAADVGYTYTFAFDAKLGNLVGSSTAVAFIKTIDPAAGFATTNFISVDMTSTPVEWTGYSLSIDVTAILEGKLLQFGFANTATLYESSGVFYDNIDFSQTGDLSSVPDELPAVGATLSQNYPNPFNPSTRIDFNLEKAGNVDVSVFDLAGRKITTLHSGGLDAGPHHVTWTGRSADGAPVATGHYRYVLTTPAGRVSRGMVLLK